MHTTLIATLDRLARTRDAVTIHAAGGEWDGTVAGVDDHFVILNRRGHYHPLPLRVVTDVTVA